MLTMWSFIFAFLIAFGRTEETEYILFSLCTSASFAVLLFLQLYSDNFTREHAGGVESPMSARGRRWHRVSVCGFGFVSAFLSFVPLFLLWEIYYYTIKDETNGGPVTKPMYAALLLYNIGVFVHWFLVVMSSFSDGEGCCLNLATSIMDQKNNEQYFSILQETLNFLVVNIILFQEHTQKFCPVYP